MAGMWSDEKRVRTWLAVEVGATETLAAAGIVPKEAAKAIHARADFSVDRIFQIEAEVKHDVIAFTTAVAEIVGPHARWFHYGLTSNDVVDTAQALLIQQASVLIASNLDRLAESLERLDAPQDPKRNPPSAAHRSPRGGGIFQRKAEGLVGHAAQA